MWKTVEEVRAIKEKYPLGTRIKMNHMDDPCAIFEGMTGTVRMVDDQGQIAMKWDNGRSLALIPDVDDFEIVGYNAAIKIIVVEPRKSPKVAIIDNSLEAMQAVVGGHIEAIPYDSESIFVGNKIGKSLNLEANRRIGSDIIAGTFFITCDDGSDNFVSLSDEQCAFYIQEFSEIEQYSQEDMYDDISLSMY